MDGVVPMTVQFRAGETETMGFIEKVSYEIKGNQGKRRDKPVGSSG